MSRRLLPILTLPAVLAAVGLVLLAMGATHPAASQADAAKSRVTAASALAKPLHFQPELGVPAHGVELLGATTEAAGASSVWALGRIGEVPAPADGAQAGELALMRRSAGVDEGWQVVPVADAGGTLGFTNSPAATGYQALAPSGGIALLGTNAGGEQTMLTRNAGGSTFAIAPAPPQEGAEQVLGTGEHLYTESTGVAVALEEAESLTGALVVPVGAPSGVPLAVLHYDGVHWAREPICASYSSGPECSAPETSASLKSVLAIAASSPQNAWLLGTVESGGGTSLALFQRISTGAGGFVWVQPPGWSFAAGLPAGTAVAPLSGASTLTVTSTGVWVDATIQHESGASISRLFSTSSPSRVLGTWCYPSPQALCGSQAQSLGALLPEHYESFAWPGSEGSERPERIIAGLEHGALLVLQGGGGFQYVVGAGGSASGARAAFVSPTEGWLSGIGSIGKNGAQVEHVTGTEEAPQLQPWPLPFRRPLLAIAPEPGSTSGSSTAQALAVGEEGQIARYVPGQGWTPEFLYEATGKVATPSLRGVAWPEAGRAYAVGEEGAMWIWRAETGLWEPDPAKPVGFDGNLEAIAFSPTDPTIGYAVGKQGVLLGYDKTWTQQPLPAGLEKANFTSVAFAGEEVFATYRMVNPAGTEETGGMIVKEAKKSAEEAEPPWRLDAGVQALLSQLPSPADTVLSKVAGLPDGGAVAAGPGLVIECSSGCSEENWHFSGEPLPEAQNVAALAAFREGSSIRALVSIDADALGDPNENGHISSIWEKIDSPAPSVQGQPPVQLEPDPLPVSGYLLRETSTGWQDLEHQAYPEPLNSTVNLDEPAWPDAVLALDVDPDGGEGWAVGGQTGSLLQEAYEAKRFELSAQTAAAMRLGSGPPPPQSEGAAIATPSGQATFAVGGDAQCAGPCAAFANEGLGPDEWLSSAVARAAQIPGLRGFLYTGSHVAPTVTGATPLDDEAFEHELAQYHADLSSGGVAVYPAASPTDIQPQSNSLAAFDSTILGEDAGTAPPGTPPPPAGSAAYAFESGGSGGPVRVIVLDYSAPKLAPEQLSWLEAQLTDAKSAGVPAIVMGSADLVNPEADNYAQDAATVDQVLLRDGASAYFFDSPGANRSEQIGSGTNAIPAFGTGTLGYVLPIAEASEFLGSNGFLLASVNVAQRNPATNRAPVSVTLTPNIAELGLYATDGTLLRRSQVALFQGLARLPQAGFELAGGLGSGSRVAPEPYVPIPEVCQGVDCSQFIAPSYTFSSSEEDIGDFVEREISNSNPLVVRQGSGGKPILCEKAQPGSAACQSGLFCAFNAGTTVVSITTGGLTYSETVTVQAGSVEQPCGTVPLKNPPPASSSVHTPAPPLSPSPTPSASPTPVSITPPPPPQPVPPAVKPVPATIRPRPVPPPLPFFIAPVSLTTLTPVLLPPPPPVPRPIPPSGTSPIFQTSVAPEEEREEEEATESVHNMAVYAPEEARGIPTVPLLLGLAVIAAAAGVTIRGGRSARRRAPAFVKTDSLR